MPFETFSLLPELQRAVDALGFKEPTPIQERSIPAALEGRDVLGSAQTGSGKTAAFALPVLQRLMAAHKGRPEGRRAARALVLVPTRELAAQVTHAVVDLSKFSPVRSALIIGGTSFHDQAQRIKAGAEVLVATPGRLLDHHRQRTADLSAVEVVVLDEADRMLDMGFIPDVRRILHSLPPVRQTLMFSATIPPEVERIVREFMREPVRVEVDRPSRPAAGINQRVYPVTSDQKPFLLVALLKTLPVTSAVVFTRTKVRADRVTAILERQGLSPAVLHSDLSQAQRTRVMEGFRGQKHRILVATDIASRGLDVRHVSHVFNYDVPEYPEDYVHRIGRTGRVFSVGEAVTLAGLEENRFVAAIERFIGQDIPRAALEGFAYRVQPLLRSVKPPPVGHFRLKRTIARSSRRRFGR